jgi:hypothetical protein
VIFVAGPTDYNTEGNFFDTSVIERIFDDIAGEQSKVAEVVILV